MTKAELRAHFSGRLRALTGSERDAASVAILRAVIGHRVWGEAKLVCAFLPLASEPQIAALWEREGGPSWCFPRSRGGEVELIAMNDPAALRRATWKMDAPEMRDAASVVPAEVDLFILPGLAFTEDGRRLGRGSGFYDRLLVQRSPRSVALGVCFALQLVEDLPVESHDQRVDAVLTEGGAASAES